MTTARDVIARVLSDFYHDGQRSPADLMAADDVVAALLSAPESVRLELAAKLNPWRGIETAPKDGTDILVLATEQGAYSWYVVSYDLTGNRGDPDYPWETEDGVAYHRDALTHWLPLPAPPSEDKPK